MNKHDSLGLAVGDVETNRAVSNGKHFGLEPKFKKRIGENILDCI